MSMTRWRSKSHIHNVGISMNFRHGHRVMLTLSRSCRWLNSTCIDLKEVEFYQTKCRKPKQKYISIKTTRRENCSVGIECWRQCWPWWVRAATRFKEPRGARLCWYTCRRYAAEGAQVAGRRGRCWTGPWMSTPLLHYIIFKTGLRIVGRLRIVASGAMVASNLQSDNLFTTQPSGVGNSFSPNTPQGTGPETVQIYD